MKAPFFRKKLKEWFLENARELPWRKTSDPYRIWICEIMSQQTTIAGLLDYYQRFLLQFPTVHDLALASEESVLKAWEGLGYYSRARNLKKAAMIIVKEFGGDFPQTRRELLTLPGIGAYSAGAILSIAFGQRELAIDGNFLRVYARFFGLAKPIDQVQTQKSIWQDAQILMPKTSGSEMRIFTESVMELGALICRPKSPQCGICPIRSRCSAFQEDRVEKLPVKSRKLQRQKLREEAYLFEHKGSFAVFHKGEDPKYPHFHRLPVRAVTDFSDSSQGKLYKYSVTIRDIELRVLQQKPPRDLFKRCMWLDLSQLEKVTLPAVDRRIVNDFLYEN